MWHDFCFSVFSTFSFLLFSFPNLSFPNLTYLTEVRPNNPSPYFSLYPLLTTIWNQYMLYRTMKIVHGINYRWIGMNRNNTILMKFATITIIKYLILSNIDNETNLQWYMEMCGYQTNTYQVFIIKYVRCWAPRWLRQ